MRIFDVDDKYLGDSDDQEFMSTLDFEEGQLVEDKIFKEHHEAVEAVPRKFHYAVTCVYFEDGTMHKPEDEDDPRITTDDPTTGRFDYVPADGEEPKEVRGMDLKEVEDEKGTEAKEAWDEYEDIQRYQEYTEEEKKTRKEEKERKAKEAELLGSGLDRLVQLEEQSLEHQDQITTVGQQVEQNGGSIANHEATINEMQPVVEETAGTVEDVILILADIIGGEEEEV